VIPRSGQPAPRAIATQAPERPALAPYRGTITAGPGARFQRLGGQPDEVVRLHEGIITCEVAPLRAGERFRVLVGDGEIEVHGTTFTLEAGADRLVAVSVREGLVELRPREAPPVHLGASARWQAPVPTAAPRPPARPPEPPRASTRPPEPPRARRHARAASGPAAPAPPRPSIAEQTFADAWAALREGQLERAAAAFARVSDAEPGSPLAEDAAFWRAVALQRARHAPEARRALEAFLAGHPLSDRAGEASVMLGWLLLDAGEPAAAAGRFRAALGDRLEPVRRSAEAGLAATGHGH
jgi:TolA-binding protein